MQRWARPTRREAILAAGSVTASALLTRYGLTPGAAALAAPRVRGPGSLPDPSRPPGAPTNALPFDHIVMVMQENHSFDNYFGMLPRRGQPNADGFTFDAGGTPTNTNPLGNGVVRVTHAPSRCQPQSVTQAWTPTHKEIDGGAMDGFARVDQGQMYYYDESDIPFYYSLANAFTLANRWFCSAPCQTYPNRRFFLCGTAFGLISTDSSKVGQSPPNGTIVDRLNAHGISWKDYFVDVPSTAVILDIPRKNPLNMAPIAQFFSDCAVGTLPAVSWVSSEIGALNVIGSGLANSNIPLGNGVGNYAAAQDQDEENPADIAVGESFVASVVNAVLHSPAWSRTLLIWLYDEHGGYYDHVPPPAAIPPDSIKPDLGPDDYPGGYDIYGPRVPAVVVSPYSKPHGVSNVVYDHTSVLATIEAKWNLPAMTYRDANAATLADFLDTSHSALLEPPVLANSSDLATSESNCQTAEPHLTVLPAPATTVVPIGAQKLSIHWYGRQHGLHGVLLRLHTNHGTVTGLVIELRHQGHAVAREHLARIGSHSRRVVLRSFDGLVFPNGAYTLIVRHRRHILVRRTVRLR